MKLRILIFITGFILGGGSLLFVGDYIIGITNFNKSSTAQALATRIESISIAQICQSIKTGKQILGEDLVTVWSDNKRYLIMGWQVEKSSIPVTYWTGADIPSDISDCNR